MAVIINGQSFEMVAYQEIIIDWSKRQRIETIDDLDKIKIEKAHALYLLYGDHHIYGRDTLLYIGISAYVDNRIKTHFNGVFGYVNNLSVSFGKIEDYNDSLEIPESILIACHKPSYNKEFIHDISPKAKQHKIIVINNGNNEMLKTCCSNFWWAI